MRRDETTKFLETVGGSRCPCGHLQQRHRKPDPDFVGEKMGACRDCDCRGLIDFGDFESPEHHGDYLRRICPPDGMSCGACPTTGCDGGVLRTIAQENER